MTNERHEKALEAATLVDTGSIHGFLYGDQHMIRDLRQPPSKQEVWSITQDGDDYQTAHSAMMQKIDCFCLELRFAVYLQAMEAVIVPKEPDNEMLDGARHLIMWMDFDRPTEQALISHCKRLGKDAPVSCRDVDHVPPKALRTFWIYQAMLSKAPNHFTNGE